MAAANMYIMGEKGNVIFTGNNQDAMSIAAGITGAHTRGRNPEGPRR